MNNVRRSGLHYSLSLVRARGRIIVMVILVFLHVVYFRAPRCKLARARAWSTKARKIHRHFVVHARCTAVAKRTVGTVLSCPMYLSHYLPFPKALHPQPRSFSRFSDRPAVDIVYSLVQPGKQASKQASKQPSDPASCRTRDSHRRPCW